MTKHDGGRQRCVTCGHPRREHRDAGCTVPRCECDDYVLPDEPKPARRKGSRSTS